MDPELFRQLFPSGTHQGTDDPNAFLDFLGTLRQAVDPTTPGFFERGVPGFLREIAQDIQRRPLSALTPVGDVETLRAGAELTAEGRPIAGAATGALGAASLLASAVPIGGPVVKAALRRLPTPRAVVGVKLPEGASPRFPRSGEVTEELVDDILSGKPNTLPAVLADDGTIYTRRQPAEHGDLVPFAEEQFGAEFTAPNNSGWITRDGVFVSTEDMQKVLAPGQR